MDEIIILEKWKYRIINRDVYKVDSLIFSYYIIVV